ncbi:MAG: methionine synthase [Phycisphaerales bacterium]|nr:methionine synthase [Phycisphaerales bacterium]
MPGKLEQLINRRPLIIDGAMGSALQQMDLTVEGDYIGRENCVDLLVRSRPEVIQSIHESFLAVGSDAVETDTFGANPIVLAEFDDEVSSWARALNREAAEVARAACDAHATADAPRFVLGSMGPGTRLITLGQVPWEAMLESYAEQARGLIDGGVDAFLIETCQDLLQVKCAVNACLKAMEEAGRTHEDIPIMVSVTIETTGTMLLGTEIAAAVNALRSYPIFSLGLNCATGPREMTANIEHLSRAWPRRISCVPNAGLPVLVEGRTEFPLQPLPLSETIGEFIDRYGVDIIGGCCGTRPEHIELLAGQARSRQRARRDHSGWTPGCASLYAPVDYRQEASFFIVGERLNASGSRRFKRLLESDDIDEMVSLARQQVREGANCLDLNVDATGRDNAADMARIVESLVRQVDKPLMLDSTQIATIESGLRHAGGRCIINSANFEDGEEKFDRFCELAKTFGAALVIGTIDEDPEAAMARTADRKESIARRAIERAVDIHGLAVEDLFIDPLVLPISTGMDDDRRSALELIDGVRRIASAWPTIQITCGLSNCSFGLKPAARQVLNSVFLWELMDAGLTSAIVHASKIQPMNRIDPARKQAALDLIYDRRALSHGGTGLPANIENEDHDPLQAFIDLFDDDEGTATDRVERKLSLEEWLQTHIVDGEKQGLIEHLEEAMQKYAPVEIINNHLLSGMKTVGELFGSGQMQLPFVLQSAEVMKMAVTHLEPHMEKVEGSTRGRVVLATVKGDVHDIGKNLVDIILSNNGWTVHNIGIKQPIEDIVQAWRETGADAIGMSGLLVKSVMVMEDNLAVLNEMGIGVPVLLGGAALSRHYCESHLRNIYQGPLYYGKDAFDGLRICDLLAEGRTEALDAEIDLRLAKRAAVETRVNAMAGDGASDAGDGQTMVAERSDVARDIPVPGAPFWGSRLVEDIPLTTIYPYVNTVALFRGQWGFRKGDRSKGDYQHYLDEQVQPIFDRLKQSLAEDGILQPKLVYGWYPVAGDGDDLVVFDPEDHASEIERFTFPRQSKRRRLCISDFFRDADSGERDALGLSCVTMGSEVSELAARLFADDAYQEYLYVHGMGVECAEALAELWHKRMREELGIDGDDSPHVRDLFTQTYRGSRYSFGYPACPDMSHQEILFRLLEPDRIGCTLTENWQIDPEQSTSAIIVHHPEAKYFNV